jgi:hypothetical protein
MLKHSLKKINDVYQLQVNGQPCVCPFKNPIPVQDKFGQLQLLNQDCNSLCPLFAITYNEYHTVDLLCSSNTVVIFAPIDSDNKVIDLK